MQNDYLDYIAHHGILGQKHGVRNGPPYPLSPSDYSYQERRLAKANANKNRYEKKSERANAKGDKLYRKAEKLIAKSNVNKLKGAAPIRTKFSDAKLDKSIRQGAQALRLLQKNDDLKIKSLKYSDKAKEFAEEAKNAQHEIDESDRAVKEMYDDSQKVEKSKERLWDIDDKLDNDPKFQNYLKNTKAYKDEEKRLSDMGLDLEKNSLTYLETFDAGGDITYNAKIEYSKEFKEASDEFHKNFVEFNKKYKDSGAIFY